MGLGTVTCTIVCLAWILSLCNGDPVLLFANHHDIQKVDAGTVPSPRGHAVSSRNIMPTVVKADLEEATVVDFLYEDGSIFWISQSTVVIKRMYLNDTQSAKTIVSKDSLDGLAVDWVNRKLYWSDSEEDTIEVATLDGEHRKVLFWQRLYRPGPIVLDPIHGYMYWTDWGEVPKIERAGMDGREETRSSLVTENILWPSGLTLDHEMAKLYFVDIKLEFIHSCDLDGSNRQPVIDRTLLVKPFAITVYADYLYWTDWQSHSIHGCHKLTGSNCFTVLDKIFAPMDIHALMPSRQPKGHNLCGDNNGGCSHLCLLSPVAPYYTCACPTGVKLQADNKTCNQGAEKLLLLARRTDIRKISLDTPDYTDIVVPLVRIKHAIAIDFDTVSSYVYWTDDEVHAIQRAHLDGSNQEVVTNSEVIRPEGIAVDWIAQNLYWTDTGTDRIEVARVNGSSRKVLISDGLKEPRAICLHPALGYMYWTDWGKPPMISRAYLDGSHREVIISTGIEWPNGLAIDVGEGRIYWGDATEDCIESANLDGTDRKVIISDKLEHIFGFSVLDEYIYWTDWQNRAIERVKKNGLNRTTIVEHLPDLMGLKAINVNEINDSTNTCAENNGNCSHLCLYRPPPLERACACPMGLELRADGRTCIVPDAFLLFSSRTDIRRLSLETSHNSQPIPIHGLEKAMTVDFDIMDSRIYWTDGKLQQISRAYMNGSSLQHIIQFGLAIPEGLAVDWIAHNIYWADTGKNRIEVARLDGSSRKALVWRNLDNPRALALDPPNGYIYWSLWGTEPVLQRAHLDGTKIITLIHNPGHIQDLTIDYVDRRLYWADVSDHSIKSSNMLGEDIHTIVEDKIKHPVGLSQYEGFVYWTDPLQGTIERASKIDGSNRTVIQSGLDYVNDILVFHSSRQAGSNACGLKNGGCSHLCLAHPLDDPKNETHHCACPTHYELSSDNHTCTAPEYYLLFSTRNSTTRMVINSKNEVDSPDVTLPINGMKNIKALDYDPVEEYIYWIEGRQRVIRRAHDNGTMMATVVAAIDNDFQPYDMAIDPYARTIYWTCTVDNVINVTRIDTPESPIGVIMDRQEFKPRSLVLYPEKGKMYYTNMYGSPKIETALMDGSEFTELFYSALESPQALTIDKKENRLYWADSRLNRIEYADLTGGNRKVLVDGLQGNPRGLAIYGKFLYWLNKEQNHMERIHKKNGNKHLWVRSRLRGLSDLIAVTHSQSPHRHPCYPGNKPGCSHLCFKGDNQEARCSCPIHLMLKKDQQTCAEPPTCDTHEFKCRSGSVQCIPKVWECDLTPECEDESDEDNCPKCKEDEFNCKSGGCIDHSLRCDGIKSCQDGSDEMDCCADGDAVSPDGSCRCADCDEEDGDCPTCYSLAHLAKSNPQQRNSKASKDYTIAFVVVAVFFVVVLAFVFVCRHKAAGGSRGDSVPADEDIMMVKKPLKPLLIAASGAESDGGAPPSSLSPHSTALMSRGKSQATGISMGSAASTGGPPQFYDRSHVTGASSSSSTVTHYPQETLNPPPSPVTDRSVYAAPTGDVYVSLNSLASTAILEQTPMVTTIGQTGQTGRGRRRHHHRRHHHHHYHHIPSQQPLLAKVTQTSGLAATTTPCTTDVCEDSEPYHQPAGSFSHHHHHYLHHHHHHPTRASSVSSTATPLHTSTPASNKKHSRLTRSRKPKKLKYFFTTSGPEPNYDSDPYPPPPTPHSHYFSDDVSCPPSPSTERSFFNPYPPPPSPVATSDC